jgi:aspartate 1-decarboxylase
MLVHFLKSKIHRIKVTQAELNYMGSITLDANLIEAAGMFVGEKVQVVNINNGERLETYIIEGERGSGTVCLNGPAARKVSVGDLVIVMSYGILEETLARVYKPIIVFPDHQNKIIG